jgi:DNA polymerase III alpha subunit
MAFAKADDGTGVLDLVVFPKIFKMTRDFWVEGQPLLICGRVDVRDESPNLLVESIETMTSLGEKKEREVFVKIPKNADANTLKKLKELFTGSLGDQTAFLIFEGGRRVRLPFKIAWNETLAKAIAETLDVQYNN